MAAQPEPKTDPKDSVTYISRERGHIEPERATKGPLSSFTPPLRTNRNRWIGIGLLVLVALGVTVWLTRPGVSSAPAAKASEQSAIPLVTVTVPSMQAVTTSVTFTGAISARHDMPIGAESEGGRITAIYVEQGDRVKRGQRLAKLDDSVLRPQINRLAAALEEAKANAALAEAEYTRARGVEASGALSSEEIERRRASALTAAAQVKVASAALAEAQARLSRTEIRAPEDGIVLTRTAEVGQMTTPGGEPLFRLAAQGEVEMRGQVAEQDLPNIKAGQSANVRLSGVAEPFKGTVRLLGAVIDPLTRLGEIRVALEPHPMLRPGSFARGEVIVDRAQRQVVPQTAVLSDDKSAYVYIVNDSSQVERRDVKVGGSVPDGIVIASGLRGNERVIATAASFLRVGERVEATPATAKQS